MSEFDKEFYLCDKCDVIHKKNRQSDGSAIKVFKDHLEHAIEITNQQRLNFIFKKRWRKEASKVNK